MSDNQIFWERVVLTTLPYFLAEARFSVDEAISLAIKCADILLGARQERMNAEQK